MKQNIFAAAALMVAVLCLSASSVQAQTCRKCGGKLKRAASNAIHGTGKLASVFNGGGATFDGDGRVQPRSGFIDPRLTLALAAQDFYSPNPIYAYSDEGARAGRTHAWNQGLQNQYTWHGNYNTWRYGQPTAVVVPPTASYQSTYAWGVGQTRSTPIHHQFGRGAGSSGGSADGYQDAPYFPSNTNQFGYYPVRANW